MLTIKEKYDLVMDARSKSYSPYSKFKVGALCILKDGTTIGGCNIENASYGLCMCAERNAMYSVITRGYNTKDIVELVVIGDTEKPISPCGACRQVMAELLNKDTVITLMNVAGDHIEYSIEGLLPYAFDDGDLNG